MNSENGRNKRKEMQKERKDRIEKKKERTKKLEGYKQVVGIEACINRPPFPFPFNRPTL